MDGNELRRLVQISDRSIRGEALALHVVRHHGNIEHGPMQMDVSTFYIQIKTYL